MTIALRTIALTTIDMGTIDMGTMERYERGVRLVRSGECGDVNHPACREPEHGHCITTGSSECRSLHPTDRFHADTDNCSKRTGIRISIIFNIISSAIRGRSRDERESDWAQSTFDE